MNPTKTGQFIQELRKERKLTQTELAEMLMITNKAVSRWETGDGFPDVVILPKISEILGASVDEILKGERITKETNKQKLHHVKLKNASLVSMTLIILSFVLFVALTYATYRAWIGFIGYIVLATLGLLFILIERNRFMVACTYDDKDQQLLFKSLFINVSAFVIGFFMTVPQILQSISSDIVTSVITFDYYLLAASIFGLVGFFIVLCYFVYFYQNGKNLKHHKQTANTIFIYLGLAAGVIITNMIIHQQILFVGVPGLILYIGMGIYYLMRRQDKIIVFLFRVWTSMIFIYSFNSAYVYEGRIWLLQIASIATLLMILVFWVLWFKDKQFNQIFRFAYQSLFFLLYGILSNDSDLAILVTLFALIAFEVVVVSNVKKTEKLLQLQI
ncbi:helix-turn-helix domain-containing protein [Peloplasma aerotolerans]|uniref:Helix-turn-helix transcriptional regulator n=1 Tax=Peloplasma aerotolerans TaxID=3044389 RepID=A0AAW6U7F6_9MOLU|nr:helix-turn-helix transcriptional regulator [Mariniplasma sp. M4Ah]MDI6452860.1 helix-turn-helix transcriptional regulator [Mariniplasma sp. M4Ah]